jgi:Glycosyltransferase like family
VIAFLVAVADQARFDAVAAPSIERVREADSLVVTVDGAGGAPQLALNVALDELATIPDLEAVVLLHEDVRLVDVDTATIVRRAFADPAVALAGPVGSQGVVSLAWWDGTGIGRARTPHVPGEAIHGVAPAGPVDALDGIVLCLSPWAVRVLRFEPELAADFHGYDIDLCFQARHHGRRVEVVELDVVHEHRPIFDDTDAWVRNELRFQQRWFEHRPVTLRRHRMQTRADGRAPERSG